MITKWKLFNFKSIQKETELSLAPLTIFSGANSSGKSTVLQSMLLIAQTLSSKIRSRSVVLNGYFTKLGQFDDVRSFSSEADQILIGWECAPLNGNKRTLLERQFHLRTPVYYRSRSPLKSVSCEISFDIKGRSESQELSQLQPMLFSSTLASVTEDEDKTDSQASITINRETAFSRNSVSVEESVDRESRTYQVSIDNHSLEEIHDYFPVGEPAGCSLFHFLPENILIKYNKAEEIAFNIATAICEARDTLPRRRYHLRKDPLISKKLMDLIKEYLGESGIFIERIEPKQLNLFPDGSEFHLSDLLYTIQRLPNDQKKDVRIALDDPNIHSKIYSTVLNENKPAYSVRGVRLPMQISDMNSYLRTFFSQDVKYLGPLRDEPRSLYPLEHNMDPTDVGLQGEHTAAVLNNFKGLRIRYIPSQAFEEPVNLLKEATRTLESAIIDWIKYLGVADSVETHDKGKHGHELKVTTEGTNTPQDLTHVGVGVSQVLPILVMCLLSETDTTIIIEQPELHLHPRVQTRLADFFLSMAMLGKQCIIESHSEYIINRLRYRIASDKSPTLKDLLKIYFAEKKGPQTSFREVAVNEYGAVLDWPQGFFDQSQREAEEILRAAMKKKQLARSKGDS